MSSRVGHQVTKIVSHSQLMKIQNQCPSFQKTHMLPITDDYLNQQPTQLLTTFPE